MILADETTHSRMIFNNLKLWSIAVLTGHKHNVVLLQKSETALSPLRLCCEQADMCLGISRVRRQPVVDKESSLLVPNPMLPRRASMVIRIDYSYTL